MEIKLTIDISPDSATNLANAFSKILGSGQCSVPAVAGTDTAKAAEAPAKPAKAPKADKPAPPPVTLDDLRVAATKCVDAGKKDKLLAINKDTFGVAGISKLDPKQYADALKAYEALAKEPAEEEEDPTA